MKPLILLALLLITPASQQRQYQTVQDMQMATTVMLLRDDAMSPELPMRYFNMGLIQMEIDDIKSSACRLCR